MGFVSPDLHRHSVTYFLEPLLAARDRAAWEVVAYSDTLTPDDVTARLRGMCDMWRYTAALSDAELAAISTRSILMPAEVEELLAPIPYMVPAQLFAALLADAKGLNPDMPRSLSKVTRTL